jgi:hypothetical protein
VEAASNEELNGMLRNIAVGGALQWQVTPLQAIAGRAAQEREIVEEFKQSM